MKRAEKMCKKIVFVVGGMKRGGAERVISILSREYIRKGWNVSIVLLLFSEIQYKLEDKISIIDLSGKISSRVMRAPYWLVNLRKYLKKEEPDVVVSFAARINVLMLLSAFGLDTKKIISERNDPIHDGRGRITKLLIQLLYPGADKIVFQTTRIKGYFNDRIRKKGVVIYNPIEVSADAQTVDSHKIVSVGRLEKQKNHYFLIEAFSNIVKKYPEYELWIYGEGTLRNDLENLINRLGINNRVFLPGIAKNVHEQIANAEMCVLSSDYEGLSNALMEAMMMGLPCISTNCAGSDELIQNNENGLLVSVGNREELEAAMEKLILDKGLANKLSTNAKNSSKKYSIEAVMRQWDLILQ